MKFSGKWEKVTNTKPNAYKFVLLCDSSGNMRTGYRASDGEFYVGGLIENPTHYMELPEPPKKGAS